MLTFGNFSRRGFVEPVTLVTMAVLLILIAATGVSLKMVQDSTENRSEAAVTCVSQPDSNSCGSIPGCTWQTGSCNLNNCYQYPGYCTYSPAQTASCQYFTSQGSCTPNGCTWTSATYGNCRDLTGSGSGTCNSKTGCSWVNTQYASCQYFTNQGTCTPSGCTWQPAVYGSCSSFNYSQCSTTGGCTWNVGKCVGPYYCDGMNYTTCQNNTYRGCGWQSATCSGQYFISSGSCQGQYVSVPAYCGGNQYLISPGGCQGTYTSVPERCTGTFGYCTGTPIVSPTVGPSPTPAPNCSSPAALCKTPQTISRACFVNGAPGTQTCTATMCSYSSPFTCTEGLTNCTPCVGTGVPTVTKVPTPTANPLYENSQSCDELGEKCCYSTMFKNTYCVGDIMPNSQNPDDCRCRAKLSLNAPCGSDAECKSGFCSPYLDEARVCIEKYLSGHRCTAPYQCQGGYCNLGGGTDSSEGVCGTNSKSIGANCNNDSECVTNNCVRDIDGTRACAPAIPKPTPKPTTFVIAEDRPNGYACDYPAQCRSRYCSKDPVDNTMVCANPPSTYVCSISGVFALAINPDGGIDSTRSKRCELGCKNGSCIGNAVKQGCTEGEISLDGFEICRNGVFACIPGRTRQPMISGKWVEVCNNFRQVTYSAELSEAFYKNLSCNENSLYRTTTEGHVQMVQHCPDNMFCLDSYLASKPGCYTTKETQDKLGCFPGSKVYDSNNQPFYCTTNGYQCIPGENYGPLRFCSDATAVPILACLSDTVEEIQTDKICTTIRSNLNADQITLYDYWMLIGQTCEEPNKFGYGLFSGTVYQGNKTWENCSIYCSYDPDINENVARSWGCNLKPSTDDSERYCDGVAVMTRVENKTDPVLVEYCGMEGCKDGLCKAASFQACETPGEIRPHVSLGQYLRDRYVYCDGETGVWQPYLGMTEITWNNCPPRYQKVFLEQIGYTPELVAGDLPISCYEQSLSAGGWVTWEIDEVALACGDPTLDKNANWCQRVTTHELAHHWVMSQEDNNKYTLAQSLSFNQVIGCKENPLKPGTYIFDKEPVSTYGTTNCAEAFAEAAVKYRWNACEMKESHSSQYEYFLTNEDSPFYGKEFCDE
jgi:hypothetical protein